MDEDMHNLCLELALKDPMADQVSSVFPFTSE